MKINIPFRYRVGIYLANVLGTPVVVYLRAKGIIGDLELTLWGAEIAAAFVVAGLNASTADAADRDGDVLAYLKQRDRRADAAARKAELQARKTR